MDAKARDELAQIKQELKKIITELTTIRNGVKNNLKGIGNDRCAESIQKVIQKCQTANSKLNAMDLNKVTDEFAAQQTVW